MSIEYTDITTLPRYPDLYVSKSIFEAVRKDGLIEPLVVKDGEIIDSYPYRERWKAFYTLAESHGDAGAKTVITVDWNNLDAEEREDI